MMHTRAEQRGFTLVVTLIVVVIATLLVMGAVAFSGAERGASGSQMRSEVLNACTHAARNMFLSRLTFQSIITGRVGNDQGDVALNEEVVLSGAGANQEALKIWSGHFGTAVKTDLTSFTKLQPNQVSGASTQVQDLSNRLSEGMAGAGYFNVHATCKDTVTGAEQELEFIVRVGL